MRRPNKYPVPVQVSEGPAGTSIPVGWKIVIIADQVDGEIIDRPYFVRENDRHY
jgi:hypothetical protein